MEIDPCTQPHPDLQTDLDFLIRCNLLGPLSSGIEAAVFEFEYETEVGGTRTHLSGHTVVGRGRSPYVEERVRENILALPSILDDIIAAEGCTISEFSHIKIKGKIY